MVNPELFFDTSALFSGIISPTGAARALLILAEAGRVNLTISMQVTIEMERTLSAKAPEVIASYRSVLKSAGVRIVANPSILESTAFENIIVHNEDAPILAAAVACSTDFLVTHNSKHFTEDPGIAQITGLRIGSPGDALAWVRQQFGIDNLTG